MDKGKNLWWGYKHVSGTYQTKRFFEWKDIEEALESDFCQSIVGPFEADSREEALEIVKVRTNRLI